MSKWYAAKCCHSNSKNSVAGEVFLIEMLSLLYIASVKSLNAVQPLIIELSLKKIFYLFYVANIAELYAQTNLKKALKCFAHTNN